MINYAFLPYMGLVGRRKLSSTVDECIRYRYINTDVVTEKVYRAEKGATKYDQNNSEEFSEGRERGWFFHKPYLSGMIIILRTLPVVFVYFVFIKDPSLGR